MSKESVVLHLVLAWQLKYFRNCTFCDNANDIPEFLKVKRNTGYLKQ